MNKKLENIEAYLREIFEDKLFQLIPMRNHRRKLFDDLGNALENNLHKMPTGKIHAPNKFIIFVPTEDFPDWKAHQDILNEMAELLSQLGMSRGYFFSQPPSIELRSVSKDFNQGFQVAAEFSQNKPKLPDTIAMVNDEATVSNQNIPDRAFLIVGGRENFALNKPVVNIGRHSDNDLTINEPHVSRHHAQLRAIENRFVIFDVGSTGGLLINGKSISQATLQPGDVIKIGLVNLIYVQDTTSEHPTTTLTVEDFQDNLESDSS